MYEVALPSYNRAETLRDKTLAMLTHYKIDPKHIRVFVANAEEKAKYADVLTKGTYKEIIVGIKGLNQVRDFIAEYYPLDAEIVEIDDDVSGLVQLDGKKLVPVKDFDAVIREGFKLCKENGLHLWGIAPVKNAFFMKPDITFNLKFIIGHLWGMINRRLPSHYKEHYKEDYARSLQNAVLDGGVVRFNNIAGITKIGAKGGLNETMEERAKQDTHRSIIEDLKKKYPGLVRDNPKRPMEILLARSLNAYNKQKKNTGGRSSVGATPPNPSLEGGMPKRTEAEKPPKNEISEEDRTDASIEKLTIRNKTKYNEAKAKLLEELAKITVPKIPKPSTTTSTNRGNVIGTIGRTMTLGFGDTRRGFNHFKSNEKYPKVFEALVNFGNLVVPKGWEYQTITLNHNAKAKKHVDSKNVGKSVIIGIGDFIGGEIRVFKPDGEGGKDYNLHDIPLMFNGGLLPHETQEFELPGPIGRYTMIFYKQGRKPKSPVGVGSGRTAGLNQPKDPQGVF